MRARTKKEKEEKKIIKLSVINMKSHSRSRRWIRIIFFVFFSFVWLPKSSMCGVILIGAFNFYSVSHSIAAEEWVRELYALTHTQHHNPIRTYILDKITTWWYILKFVHVQITLKNSSHSQHVDENNEKKAMKRKNHLVFHRKSVSSIFFRISERLWRFNELIKYTNAPQNIIYKLFFDVSTFSTVRDFGFALSFKCVFVKFMSH